MASDSNGAENSLATEADSAQNRSDSRRRLGIDSGLGTKFRFYFRWISISILLPLLMLGSLWFLNDKGFFNIDHIEIVLAKSSDQPYYYKPLVSDLDAKLESWRGQSLWSLDITEISKMVSSHSWLKGVKVNRQWPSRLNVIVEVKQVRFMIVGREGQFWPVAEDGQILKAVSLSQSPDVILAQGDAFLRREDLRRLVIKSIDSLPTQGSFSKNSISELRWSEKEGIAMVLSDAHLKVKLGKDKFALKSFRVGQVLDYLKAQSRSAHEIDADLSNKVIVHSPYEISSSASK
jgi:cell division protein FtsQ